MQAQIQLHGSENNSTCFYNFRPVGATGSGCPSRPCNAIYTQPRRISFAILSSSGQLWWCFRWATNPVSCKLKSILLIYVAEIQKKEHSNCDENSIHCVTRSESMNGRFGYIAIASSIPSLSCMVRLSRLCNCQSRQSDFGPLNRPSRHSPFTGLPNRNWAVSKLSKVSKQPLSKLSLPKSLTEMISTGVLWQLSRLCV